MRGSAARCQTLLPVEGTVIDFVKARAAAAHTQNRPTHVAGLCLTDDDDDDELSPDVVNVRADLNYNVSITAS